MKKAISAGISALLLAGCLTGCGKRGKLDFPPGTTYPRQYPARREPRPAEKAVKVTPAEEKQPESIWELNESLETGK